MTSQETEQAEPIKLLQDIKKVTQATA